MPRYRMAAAMALSGLVTVTTAGCSRDGYEAGERSRADPGVVAQKKSPGARTTKTGSRLYKNVLAPKHEADPAGPTMERARREGIDDPFEITDAIRKRVERLLKRYRPQTDLEKAIVLYRSIIPSSKSFQADGRRYRGFSRAGGGLQIPFGDDRAAPLRKKHGSLLPGEIIAAPQTQRVADCLEYSFLLIGLLRAAEIEADFKEQPDHAHVVSVLDGRQYRLDPANLAFEESGESGDPDRIGVAVHYSNEGVIRKEQGRLQEAIRCFDTAIVLRPGYAEALVNRGLALREQGKIAEALQCYDRALAINPRDARAWSNKGVALAGQGKLAEAMACYERSLSLQPEYHKPWNNKGIAFFRQGQFDKAVKCYDRALAIKPDYVKAWYNRGLALRAQGDLDGAVKCFERALQIRPDKAVAWYSKGVTLQKQGKPRQAQQCFERAEAFGLSSASE